MYKYLLKLLTVLLPVFAHAGSTPGELSVSVVVLAAETKAKSTHEQLPKNLCEQSKLRADENQDMDYLRRQLAECERVGTIDVVQLY